MTKTIQFSKSGFISGSRVKAVVYGRIDFELPEAMLEKIEDAFEECWNDVIGIRGWVYEGQIEKFIYDRLKKQHAPYPNHCP